jgi:predicted dithiol-disulfide oxidoreductase (DUF899 family)
MVKRRTTTRGAGRIAKKAAAHTQTAQRANALHWISFPNETTSYRKARNDLLTAEIELRRAVERIAAQRRKLPTGGLVPEDYIFEEGGASPADARMVRQVRLSELFGEKNTLVAYSFMYGPQMRSPCPMCNGRIHHFYNTELLFVRPERGQNSRHIDTIWPLWNLLDFTPEGRGTTWYPKLSYAS